IPAATPKMAKMKTRNLFRALASMMRSIMMRSLVLSSRAERGTSHQLVRHAHRQNRDHPACAGSFAVGACPERTKRAERAAQDDNVRWLRSVARSRFRGEWVNRRKGEWARRLYSSILSRTDDPFLRVIDHAHELAKDAFVCVIDCLEFGITDVAVTKCELDVHLCFGSFTFGIAKFGNESRGVEPLPPCLGNVCTKRTRRAPDLISQRKAFVIRKLLR